MIEKKKIFTLRNFGGSTISRGFSMFRTDPEVCNWIDDFDEESYLLTLVLTLTLFTLCC